jgi:hypothetical protein
LNVSIVPSRFPFLSNVWRSKTCRLGQFRGGGNCGKATAARCGPGPLPEVSHAGLKRPRHKTTPFPCPDRFAKGGRAKRGPMINPASVSKDEAPVAETRPDIAALSRSG